MFSNTWPWDRSFDSQDCHTHCPGNSSFVSTPFGPYSWCDKWWNIQPRLPSLNAILVQWSHLGQWWFFPSFEKHLFRNWFILQVVSCFFLPNPSYKLPAVKNPCTAQHRTAVFALPPPALSKAPYPLLDLRNFLLLFLYCRFQFICILKGFGVQETQVTHPVETAVFFSPASRGSL